MIFHHGHPNTICKENCWKYKANIDITISLFVLLLLFFHHGQAPIQTPERPFFDSNLFLGNTFFYTSHFSFSWYHSMRNSYKRDTNIHTHGQSTLYIYIDSCADILYYCTQLLQMDYTAVQFGTTYTHLSVLALAILGILFGGPWQRVILRN